MKNIEIEPIINLQLHELFQSVYVCVMNTQCKYWRWKSLLSFLTYANTTRNLLYNALFSAVLNFILKTSVLMGLLQPLLRLM